MIRGEASELKVSERDRVEKKRRSGESISGLRGHQATRAPLILNN